MIKFEQTIQEMKSGLILSIFLTISLLQNSFAQEVQKTEDELAIQNLLKKKRTFNKNNKKGFLIQLYNGKESTAKKIKIEFEELFPEIPTQLEYIQPEWKIQVGKYTTKLEADRALNKIRRKFAGAIVIPM